ncbi:MAG: plastocyanin/azurin family copper-binding protein [Nitrosopumilaceae archaeon]
MAAIDKAAIAWTIAIVAVGVGIASIGGQFQSPVTTTDPNTVPPVMKEPSKPVMEKPTGPMTVEVSIPAGTSVPGCEESNKCFIPSSVSIMKGDTVVWSNDDTAVHTVTSGSPANGPSGMFDSSLLIGGKSFEHTFDSSGSVDYFCMVHPWMTGSIQVS